MLKLKVKTITKQIEEMKKTILKEIETFEQNPKIKPLSKNCFIIKVSDLSKDLNLSPFYYNYKLQYQEICNIIEKTKVENILSVLNDKATVKSTYSPTTLRHIKDFLYQHGFKAENKKQILKDYAENKRNKNIIGLY